MAAEAWDVFKEHVRQEEYFQAENNERLREGNERMARIEEDLRPLKNLYHAVLGASLVGGVLVSGLIFVYQEDRQTLKGLAEALHKQGSTMEKLIQSHHELERDTTREFQRVEKTLERYQAVPPRLGR